MIYIKIKRNMTDIRCKACYELNDQNAVKCEVCKASLSDANCSEVDECENDYRFIEEAELKGQIYKLENVDDNFFFEVLPETVDKHDIKIEPDENVNEFSQISNGSNVSNNEALNNKPKAVVSSITIEPRKICEIAITLPEVPYKCNQCSKSFKRKASLNAHINRVHNPDDDPRAYFSSLPPEQKPKSESNYKRCASPAFSESCDSEYAPPKKNAQDHTSKKQTKMSLKIKQKLEETSDESDSENNNSRKRTSTKCNTNISPPLQILLNSKLEKPVLKRHMVYKCTACEKISNCYEEHIKHIVIHEAPVDSLTATTSLEKLKKTPSGFLKCDLCDGIFMSDREYARHEKMHVEQVFQCDICKAFLANKSSLRKHEKRVHKRLTPKKEIQFECVTCNQKFASMLLMVHHKKCHTDVIKKIEEMTIIKRGEGKTLYVCKICAKTSNNKYRHEEHLRIHTKEKPYKCEQCGVSIATANALAHHLRLHENDRPFQCDVCGATYRHKKSLKKHLRHHTGEKPFKCRCCERTFVFNYTRADHERKCHLGDPKIPKLRRQRSGKIIQKINCQTDVPKITVDSVEIHAIQTIDAENVKIV